MGLWANARAERLPAAKSEAKIRSVILASSLPPVEISSGKLSLPVSTMCGMAKVHVAE